MPTFDIVSEVDKQEVSNAVIQAQKEVGNRFDFKNCTADIEYANELITLVSDSSFQVDQIRSVLYSKLTKRGVDVGNFDPSNSESSGMKFRQKITIREGIDKESAKKIIKLIKESKLKVQSAIQQEQVRVTGKSRNDLQAVIALLREAKLDLPLQYINFRD